MRSQFTATFTSQAQVILLTRIVGTKGARHHTQPVFFLVEMWFRQVAQTDLELLDSSDPPALASQSAAECWDYRSAPLGLARSGLEIAEIVIDYRTSCACVQTKEKLIISCYK